MNTNERLVGCLLGTAAGDSLGLPREGLRAERAAKLFGPTLSQRLFFGRGFVSDDTEHAALTLLAHRRAGGDSAAFGNALARNLKLWILGVPPGVGLATLRACGRLLVGFSTERSGVFSAGNGPAMRAPVLGVLAGDGPKALAALVRVSSRLTHTDPRAEAGALAVAEAAVGRWPRETVEAAERGETGAQLAERLGCSGYVTGFVEHTVPVALLVSYRHRNAFRAAIEEAISLGGDADTVAAIVGGIVGARVGREGVPSEWLAGIADPAWNVARLEGIANGSAHAPNFPLMLVRNVALLGIVLWHGFRRILR